MTGQATRKDRYIVVGVDSSHGSKAALGWALAQARLTGVAVEAVARRVLVYTSPDLIHWSPASHFGPAHATDGVWECPDLFPLKVADTSEIRWVLVVSMSPGGIAGGSGTQYFVGDFDGRTFTPERQGDGVYLQADNREWYYTVE